MDENFHFYEPSKEHGLSHSPLNAIVAPRPIAWVTTVNAAGSVNLAPFSYFNLVSARPPIVVVAAERANDTLHNCEETGEFVVNMVTATLAEQMNITSAAVPSEIDEMALAGLAQAPSRIIRPPRVAASPAALECKVVRILQLDTLDGTPAHSRLIFGQVVGVHIDRAMLTEDGRFDTARAEPLARCGYLSEYTVARELFDMPRPKL